MTHGLPPAYRAVLFDVVGTLVDTMPIHYEAYRRTFAEMGLELTHDDFYDQIGGSGLETIPRFLRGRNSPWTTHAIHRRKKEILSTLLDDVEIPRLPASELLRLLHGRVPMAVATSGARAGIDKMIRRLGWADYFAVVVTAEDVVRSKPAPDLFLTAAERLKVPAAECLVFEDTDDGVEAGRAAGAAVIDVRRMAPPTTQRRRRPPVGGNDTRRAER